MRSILAAVAYIIFQFAMFHFATEIYEKYGILIAILFFACTFLVSTFALGKIAAKDVIYTYEDQQRELRKKKKG